MAAGDLRHELGLRWVESIVAELAVVSSGLVGELGEKRVLHFVQNDKTKNKGKGKSGFFTSFRMTSLLASSVGKIGLLSQQFNGIQVCRWIGESCVGEHRGTAEE
jgi:hypothetical protein